MERTIKNISIITVCLNSAQTLGTTIESVKNQTFQHIEYIVIDGGSTDGSLEIAQRHSAQISMIVSEKDAGIYDAMNKGVEKAHGDIILFLNSDDSLHDDHVISDIAAEFERHKNLDLLFGDVIYRDNHQLEQRSFRHLSRRNLIFENLCHQAVFAKRSLFKQIGKFDLHYQIAADYDWLLKIFFSDAQILYLPRNIAFFNATGEHFRNPRGITERRDIRYKYMRPADYRNNETIYRIIRKARKYMQTIYKGPSARMKFV